MIHWNRLDSPKHWVTFLVATFLGSGASKIAPGTMGSLAALPFIFWMEPLSFFIKGIIGVALFFFGTIATKQFDELMETRDSSHIVIDEVLGMGITLWISGGYVENYFFGFIFFRTLDILKPFPISIFDKFSHENPSPWLRALGVMIDDVIAGFLALGLLMILQYYSLLPSPA
tara:strand:- start:5336 stop:5854 length:519 start_codon:yes stop_codon:yes gene_type:complete